MLQKTGIRSGLMGHLATKQILTLAFTIFNARIDISINGHTMKTLCAISKIVNYIPSVSSL